MVKTLKKLAPFLKGEGRFFLAGVVALLFVDGFQLIMPRITKHAVDALAYGRATDAYLLKLALFVVLISFGIALSRFLWRFLIIGISRRMERNIRTVFYEHLLKMPVVWFSKNKTGDLMALATNDLEAVRMMVGMGMVAAFDAGFLLITSLAMMLYISPTVTLYVVVPLPVLSVIVSFLGKMLHKRFEQVQEQFAEITERVREVITGIRVVKSYAREDHESQKFSVLSQNYVKRNIRMIVIGGMFDPLIGLVVGLSFAMVLFFGGNRVILADMSMGDYVAFMEYLGLLIWPMIATGWVINLYQRGKASLDRINAILEQKPDFADTPDSVALTEPMRGEIEFRNLTFAYTPDTPNVLNDISFVLEQGTTLGITGRTGSGKTTLVSVIDRLFDPPAGTIFIDGRDIRTIKLAHLRAPIGIVPQDTYLFSATILENIKFGNIDASDEAAFAAAAAAQLDKDVEGFSEKYATLVGERGVTLSGGQKQRLAIARALLINPPVLILDDALSAVDTETEEAIFSRLLELRRGKTTIVISHRVSALQNTDKIIVLDDGRIVETGSHANLLGCNGYYAELYKIQQIKDELL